MKRTILQGLWLTSIFLTLAGLSAGQVSLGTPPFSSIGGGPFDNVNLGSLNVNFKIPVRHKAGRGLPFTYDLTFDSSIWNPVSVNGQQVWQPVNTGSYWGWQGLNATPSPGILTYSTSQSSFTCGLNGQNHWSQVEYNNFVYTDENGTHGFPYTAYYVQADYAQGCPQSGPRPPTAPAVPAPDGSGLTLYAVATPNSLSAYETTRTGTTFNGISFPGSTDANGNQISLSGGTYTDTLGQTALTVAGSPPSSTTLVYAAPSGANASYTVSYKSYTVQTNFGCTGTVEYNVGSVYLVDKITLPDGSNYQFTYEPTPSYPSNVTGRIASVTLPTGGAITYQYTGGNQGIVCADGSTAGLTRTLNPGGIWKYSRALQSGKHWQTTVTDPTTAANQTLIDFQEDNNGGNTVDFFQTQSQSYSGSVGGTVLSASITCYNTVNPTPANCPTAAVSTPISRVTSFPYLPSVSSSSKVSETDTQYSYINDPNYPTEVDSYDYGTGSPSSTPLRKVITQYNSFGNTVQPTSVQIQDGGSNVKASTTYSYDETTPTTTNGTPQHTSISGGRGNLTTLSTQASGTVTLYRKFTYYDTGNLNTATDAGTTTSGGANLTTYNYPDATSTCGNAFPGSISEPLSLSKSFTWDCNGGVMKTSTDENNQISTAYYTGSNFGKSADPNFWRPYATTDQLGNPTTLSYPSQNASESTLAFNSNTSVVDIRTTLDGLGRPIVSQREQGYNAANYDSIETDYDVAGRVSRTTQPYSATAGGTCSGCAATNTTYDALNRPFSVTDGGNGTINYTYTYSDALSVVGPAPGGTDHVKQKQLEYDGLGRLASVCEITSGTGSGTCGQSSSQTGFWTQYTYDALGDMTGVTQNAQAAQSSRETRTFTYDMMGRLASEQNPETGSTAIAYTYDSSDSTCGSYTSAGNLVEKKDALGNYTCYQYDGMHRVTSVTYPAGSYAGRTDQKHYVYDSATVNGTVMGNAKTRLAEAYTCTGSCTSKKTDLGFSYSARGEVTDAWEMTPNSGGYYHPTAAFWANGALKTLWISSLPSISYGADGEGRASTVSASSGQNPVTATSYNTASQVTGVTYGSADADAFQFDPNTGRMTQYKYTVNGSSEIGNLTWNANGSLKTLGITDPFNSGDGQTCSYLHDDLSRIASVGCGSTWAQTFSFDPFGNITKSGSISWQPGYTATTNRYTLGGTSYDSNGNLTNDTFHAYTWDSEGNSLTIDSIGLTYDAFDRVVEQNPTSGTYYQIVYTPMGTKLGLFKGATIQQLYVPLPGGGSAEYYSWGLSDYRHVDWLGSDRLESSTTRTLLDNNAYAPFGEPYVQTGNGEISFTGQNKDTDWLQYDFMFRQYDPKQGRWISPDPLGMAAVDPTNPQSWNRYAYVMNSPLNGVDLLGTCQVVSTYVLGINTTRWTPDNGEPCLINLPAGCSLVGTDRGFEGINCGAPPFATAEGSSGDSGSSSGGAANNGTSKPGHCVWEAVKAKGISLALDAIGAIPVFGNGVSATAGVARAGFAALHAAQSRPFSLAAGAYGAVSAVKDGENPADSFVGAASAGTGVGLALADASLTAGNVALQGSKAIPGLGNAVSLLTLGWDGYQAYKTYQACMAKPD